MFLDLPIQETQVLSLVGELRTQVLQGNQAHALQLLNSPTHQKANTPTVET